VSALSIADAEGREIRAELEREGVDLQHCEIREEGSSTGCSFVILDLETRGCTIFHTPQRWPFDATMHINPDDAFPGEAFFEGLEVLFTDGRYPATTTRILKRCKERGIPVLMDCERLRGNSRTGESTPHMIRECTAVSCAETFLKILYSAELDENSNQQDDKIRLSAALDPAPETGDGSGGGLSAFGSDRQLSWEERLQRKCAEWEKELRAFLADYPNLEFAVVTIGEFGSVCLRRATETTAEEFFHTRAWLPSRREIVDTTGAGDAFNAGLAFGYAQHWTVKQMTEFASVVAGWSICAYGPRGGLPKFRSFSSGGEKQSWEFETAVEMLKEHGWDLFEDMRARTADKGFGIFSPLVV